MSAAAAEPLLLLPKPKHRSWPLGAIILIDILTLELAVLLSSLSLDTPLHITLAVAVLALPVAFYSVGLYPGYGLSAVQRIRARVYATCCIFLVLFTYNATLNNHFWSRSVLSFTLFSALILAPPLESALRNSLINRGVYGLPVVIIGTGRTAALIAKTLRRELDIGWVPIGFLEPGGAFQNPTIHQRTILEDLPIIGPLSAATALSHRARLALVTTPGLDTATLPFEKIIEIHDLFAVQNLWLASRRRKGLVPSSNRLFKRLADYAITFPLLLLSLPIVAIGAAWIKIVSPGPALFRQEREGENGKRITIYKLRTMYPDSEPILNHHLAAYPEEQLNWNSYYKLKNDPRVIPGIGNFLRRYSLDELPQLWNVLRGEMSLVGPRPFPYYHLNSFSGTFRALRSSVMPGVTGLWQVADRSDGDLQIQELDDTYYIQNWSLWLDLYILIRTFESVILAKGAY